MLVNQVISNLDTYNGYYVHNYYLYQREDGLFNMIPWDLSESFVSVLWVGVFGIHQMYTNMTHTMEMIHQ